MDARVIHRCVYCGDPVDENISEQADELFKTFSNVRPSCGKGDCAKQKNFLTSNERKKQHLGKRRRDDQIPIGGAIKKQKRNIAPVTQQDLDTATERTEAAWDGVTDDWVKVMTDWWKRLRGN